MTSLHSGSRPRSSGPPLDIPVDAGPPSTATSRAVLLSPIRSRGPAVDAVGNPVIRRVGRKPTLTGSVLGLSRGNVVSIPPSGPIFDPARKPRRALRPGTLVPVLCRWDRAMIALLSLGWALSLLGFWVWWLQPVHRVGWFELVINSALLAYLSTLPVYFMIAINRLRRVNPRLDLPHLRVAFVVTKAPSEPWDVARTTLAAMLAQDIRMPYDVWLCDEDPVEDTLAWCRAHGVQVSTRRGVPIYHRSTWPRRTRCKEGNLAWFYDNWGYRDYDVVAQLDCDHVPERGYLAAMIRPFADNAVGYVAAPSVCDANAAASWSARGRLHREATFHGPFQNGHTGTLAPLCIGSHYAVRTRAVRDIGGIGPELAEDFSTTFLINSAGWLGAFAIDAEAHGDGPLTFSAMIVQEFQWSRSLTTALLAMVPRHLGRMPLRLRCRFVFALTYYPLIALIMGCGLALPFIAAVTGRPWMDINYFLFLALWALVSVWLLAATALLRSRGLLRPPKVPLLSWENALFTLTRWPYVARGVWAAVLQTVRPKQITFAITPKTADALQPLPLRLVAPYLLISVTMAAGALLGERYTQAVGYVFLSLVASASYAVVSIAVPLLHAREAGRTVGVDFWSAVHDTVRTPLACSAVALVPVLTALAVYPGYALRVLGW